MKSFVTSGTGNEQTLSEIESEKIPVYSTESDLDTDLANLADGELALYPSEGAEMSLPVDTVQSGNLHAVTSNAVAEAIKDVEIKYVSVTGTTDADGNFQITNLPANTIALVYASTPQGSDVNYNLFFSSFVQNWYIHASQFNSGQAVANATINGKVYYAKYVSN